MAQNQHTNLQPNTGGEYPSAAMTTIEIRTHDNTLHVVWILISNVARLINGVIMIINVVTQ